MKKLIVLLFSCLLGISTAFAQVDEVTLVVSGEGESLDKATTIALRSAIEQAYGAFVSANTTILNDELVQDEIVTVSSGNVKKYDILNSYDKENGHVFVTLRAIVSVKAMTAYAQSKGAECEFAGATIGQQVKLAQLNREATKKAFDNMLVELQQIAPYMFDFKLKVPEPNIYEYEATIDLAVQVVANDNFKTFNRLIATTIEALAQDPQNDKTHTLRGPYLIIYPNPRWHRKAPKTLIGTILCSPFMDYKKALYFYSAFPEKEIQKIVIDAATHFFVYDNNNTLYTFYSHDSRYHLYNGFHLEYSNNNDYPKLTENDYNNYQISRFNREKSQDCWLWEKWSPRAGDSGYDICLNMTYNEDDCLYMSEEKRIKFSIKNISQLSKFSISKETSEFENYCDKIDPESYDQWEDLYATSIFMGCDDIFSQKKQLAPGMCKAAKASVYNDKDKYLSFLISKKIMPQETMDTYTECERNYKNCYEDWRRVASGWYRDARKEREREQRQEQLEAKMKEYQECMTTILHNYWYEE